MSVAIEEHDTKMSVRLTPQELRWVSLLHNRPNTSDGEATEKWLESVLEVSEPSTTVQSPAAKPSIQNQNYFLGKQPDALANLSGAATTAADDHANQGETYAVFPA